MVILVYPYANIDGYDGDRFTVFIIMSPSSHADHTCSG